MNADLLPVAAMTTTTAQRTFILSVLVLVMAATRVNHFAAAYNTSTLRGNA